MTMTPLIRHGYAACGLGQLHYLEGVPREPTSRRPLVLFHQNPSTSEEYRFLVAAMAQDRRVVAFDTPGYGMSDPPAAPISAADYAAIFCDGIAALGLADDGPVDLFGFHTGTLLAIEVGARLGDRAGRLVLAGIPFRPVDERQVRLDQIHAVALPTEDGAAIFERLRWLWNFVVTERHPDVPIERAAAIFAERAKPLHRYWWAYEGVWTYDIEVRLQAIAQPTLVLLPDEMLREQSLAAAALIPGARTLELPRLTRDIFEQINCAVIAKTLHDDLDRPD